MPLSTALFLACMTVMRWLCFAAAALFLMLAIRAQFDADIALPWMSALAGALLFLLTGLACGFLRKMLARRAGRQ
jgi:hypothetical protein